MIPEQWQKAKELFDGAMKCPPDERRRFLDENCGEGDEAARREIESLLANSEDAAGFLELPAVGEVAEAIVGAKEKLCAGQSLSHYKIIRSLGAGGMGEVYLAQDKKLDRRVAVKILNEKFSRHESNLNRFIQEAKAASALNHPNILVIHEIGASDEVNYIVSEFVEGKTLRERFTESPMRLSEALDIAVQIAGALSTAHAARIVHRDIKPENVIVRPDGYVKILDFGLAKLITEKNKSFAGSEAATAKQNNTAQGVILGTVNYMSPEQAKGEKIDERTDIFSFGVLLYEMIAGRTPFAGDSNSETLANLINKKAPPLSRFAAGVPEELTHTVAETLRKKRDERYQTMKDLLADLKALREKLTFEENLERTAAPDAAANGTTAELQAAATGDAAKKQTTAQNSLFGKITKRKTATLAAFAFALIIVAVVGVYFAFFAPPPAVSSVAVLPFENATGDANFDYLSDGLSESLIDRLLQLPELKVIARSSSFKYRGADVDLRDAANRLGVQAVVIGKITRR
ncbi:MAG: serine/threonine-protein kinase, partial [Acidobacteriota bacterium]|nr:serine/threonine-protein kinase [Acidobacteriota bacterium]